MVIFGVMGAGLRNEDGLVLIYLVLTLAFFATAIYLVARRESKRVAGVSLVWALWCLPAFLPVLAGWIQRQFRRDYYYENEAAMSAPIEAHPAYAWIRDHWPLINGLNALLVIVIVAFVLIPLARRWQAMPEA